MRVLYVYTLELSGKLKKVKFENVVKKRGSGNIESRGGKVLAYGKDMNEYKPRSGYRSKTTEEVRYCSFKDDCNLDLLKAPMIAECDKIIEDAMARKKAIADLGFYYTDKQFRNMLKELNSNWGFEFVSETMGDYTESTGSMRTREEEDAYENASSYLVARWFYEGPNHKCEFKDMEEISLVYLLPSQTGIISVCMDLQKALGEFYNVIIPNSDGEAIIIKKL